MKPKQHKSSKNSRSKRKNQGHTDNHHSHCNAHVAGSNEELTQVFKSDSDEEEDGDPDLLSKSFSSKCSTKFSPGKKLSSLHEEDEEDSDWEAEGINGKCQSIVERRDQLVDRLRLYNSLFKFHKSIKEDVRKFGSVIYT